MMVENHEIINRKPKVLIIEHESNLRLINAVELNRDIVTQSKTLACTGLFRFDEICMNCIVGSCATRIYANAEVNPENLRGRDPIVILDEVTGGGRNWGRGTPAATNESEQHQ